ncbi:hypothetical protein Avbf_11821 [Armadillidium vulgare]|nr:hypothetical protein Avbf_11821 [Armadillidium vulgare]
MPHHYERKRGQELCTGRSDNEEKDNQGTLEEDLYFFRNTCKGLTIYKRLQNGEKVFAVHKINEDFKYGEVSFFSNQLFFHSLNSSQVPKDSSLIWQRQFEDAKQCLNSKDFCAFIKICYNEKKLTSFVIIETFNQCLCNEFIKLCTGECGPSYKGSFLKKGHNKVINIGNYLTNVLRVEKRIKNKSEKMRLKGYNRYLQKPRICFV